MPERLPLAYVASTVEPTRFTPGRLRLRVPEERMNSAFFSHLVEEASRIEGVLDVSAREHTGSALILYSGSADEVLNRLSGLKLFRLSPREKVSARGSWPKLSSEERAILEGGVYLALSIVQIYRGKALGAGSSLLGQAIDTVRQLAVKNEVCADTEPQTSILETLAKMK